MPQMVKMAPGAGFPVQDADGKVQYLKVCAAMTMPRLSFATLWPHQMQALNACGIPLLTDNSVFVDQGFQRCFEMAHEVGFEYLLAIDYDSVFRADDVCRLVQLLMSVPELDVVVAPQARRNKPDQVLMFQLHPTERVLQCFTKQPEPVKADLIPIYAGCFGLSLFRLERVVTIPKPWFVNIPDSQGGYGEQRIDADMYFWKKFQEHGLQAAAAAGVRIGHLQECITWVMPDYSTRDQYIGDWLENGAPPDVELQQFQQQEAEA